MWIWENNKFFLRKNSKLKMIGYEIDNKIYLKAEKNIQKQKKYKINK